MNKLKNLKIILPLILCILFIILQVVILNYDSTSGHEYEKLTSSLKELEVQNSMLEQQVASVSSILSIAQKAENLGFSTRRTVLSLYGPQPLAAMGSTL